MLCLAPAIHTFNRMCTDIVPLTGSSLPPVFFDTMVVKRLENVYQAELTWQHLDTVLDYLFGMDVTLIIKSFCDSGTLNIEGLFGRRNMNRLRIAHLRQSNATNDTEGTEESKTDVLDIPV